MESGRAYRVSLEDLERQMNGLARRAKVEDQWIYVVEDGRLYDVSMDGDAHSVSIDFSPLESGKIDIRGKNIIDIHVHAWEGHSPKDFLPVSTPDMHYHEGHAVAEYNKHGPASIRKLVYDGYGVWEYTASSEFIRSAAESGESDLLKRIDSFCREIRNDSTKERAVAVESFIARCKTVGLYMTYRSLE